VKPHRRFEGRLDNLARGGHRILPDGRFAQWSLPLGLREDVPPEMNQVAEGHNA
jgi:hypothetical protein